MDAPPDFETVFRQYYTRMARLIARMVRDPGRAEELAVDVFCSLLRSPRVLAGNPGAWLHRAAVRAGLYEIRRLARRDRVAHLVGRGEPPPDPAQVHEAAEEQQQVRAVLAGMDRRKAEMLVLRSGGLSYEDLAAALDLNPASVGTLLSRAQEAFRKEYIKRYGER